MADVLDQAEVDALLAAIDPAADDAAASDILTQAKSKQLEVRTYDFKRPERGLCDPCDPNCSSFYVDTTPYPHECGP